MFFGAPCAMKLIFVCTSMTACLRGIVFGLFMHGQDAAIIAQVVCTGDDPRVCGPLWVASALPFYVTPSLVNRMVKDCGKHKRPTEVSRCRYVPHQELRCSIAS